MKVSSMRRVDAWMGVPLCLLISSLRTLVRVLFRPAIPAGKPRSILVIKLSEMGALITLGPAMRSLTELVGRENLYFLTFAESRGLFKVLDFVPQKNIYVLHTDSLTKLIGDALTCLNRIRSQRIECSVDLDFFSRATALIGWLSGCRRRVGCHAYFGEGPYRGDLLTHRVKFNPHVHISQMFEILASAVERPAADFPRLAHIPRPAESPRERFKPTDAELAVVRRLLMEAGVAPRSTVILLNSNISDREAIPLRKWSDECYVELAKLILAGTPDAFILLTGTAKEAGTIARLEAAIGQSRCRSVAGKTTLRELLTLYAESAMMVTNDSGPAHFATITDMEVVVLFGPETPHLWRPLGDRVTVMYRGLACSPCFTVYNGRQSRCRRNACMDFSPAEVYAVIQQRLAERRTRCKETS
jgi:ADP-heptose:LPS heptosyltransferase